MNPEHLAKRAAAGDEIAFARLCRDLRGWMYHRTGRYYAPGLEQDDLLQEARLGLHAACLRWDGSTPFLAYASVVVDYRVGTAVRAATRGKHGPLNDSARLEAPGSDLLDGLIAPACTDPARIVDGRCALRTVIDTIRERLSPTEATVLVRRMNGALLSDAGAGLGPGQPYKLADNALARGRCKIVAALEAA